MTPEPRITMVRDRNRAVESPTRAASRERNAGESARDVELRLAVRDYVRERRLGVFGWDPEVRGG
jgi:hypothetical protein